MTEISNTPAVPSRVRRNNLFCGMLNLHRWEVIRQYWYDVPEIDIPALVRFEECATCGKTKASITHPYKDITCQASPVFSDMRYATDIVAAK